MFYQVLAPKKPISFLDVTAKEATTHPLILYQNIYFFSSQNKLLNQLTYTQRYVSIECIFIYSTV